MQSICIFCGSADGSRPEYLAAARELATLLARNHIRIVYGGAHVGLMGAIADTALSAGGEVIGVIPRQLVDRELAHTGLTRLEIVSTMHERKARMAGLSDAFIALPGGFGTFDELCEIITWAQLGIHSKPILLLNTAGYYGELLSFFDRAVTEGFLKSANRAFARTAATPAEALSLLNS